MRQNSLIALVSVLALFLGGCPTDNDNQENAGQSTPAPVASRPPTRPTPPAPAFTAPLTAKQPAKPTAVAGLIRSLPPEARVNQIRKNLGRSDPFAAIPTVPVLIPPSPTATGGAGNRPVPVIPQLPQQRGNAGTGGNQPGTSRGNPTTARGNVIPPVPQPPKPTARTTARPTAKTTARTTGKPTARPTARPTGKPTVPTRPGLAPPGIGTLPPIAIGPRELPTLPEPTLARGIEVTGVIEVGGVPSAIVQAPNEPSRTVRAGDRLSNGQVLVKRIEMNRGPTPVVVLEEFGQEVARQVGDSPAGAPGRPGSPTAFLGKPTPANSNVVS
ncbi:MAG: hypothetical protein M3O33_05145 [Cyanobacteriota bacterium]|nr:hypothetical protein [Cyanobacteriota bacterium]